MSRTDPSPKFTGDSENPIRPFPLSDAEHTALLAEVKQTLLPALAQAAAVFSSHGFSIVKFEQRGDLTCLVIRRGKETAWIYFQILRSFAALSTREPILWSFTANPPGAPPLSKSGKLATLDRESISRVLISFTETIGAAGEAMNCQGDKSATPWSECADGAGDRGALRDSSPPERPPPPPGLRGE